MFRRIPSMGLNHELRLAILRCFTRAELEKLKIEIDKLLADPNWTPKIL
jgi:hypothetical protein